MTLVAVITGDLINSTRVSNSHAFHQQLHELMQLVIRKYDALINLYRGDGFQVAIDADRFNAFELALLIRAGLISHSPDKRDRWDARIAIAFDTSALSTTDQNTEAYVNSGRTLDTMGNAHLKVYAENESDRLAFEVATGFVDEIINRLTTVEAEVLFYYLLYRESHRDIAARLSKKRPTVTIALQRSSYKLLDSYITAMDKIVKLSHGQDK